MYTNYRQALDGRLPQKSLAVSQARMPFLRQMIQQHFPDDKEAAILDLGCGCGDLIQMLNWAGYTNAHGVDASPEQVSIARGLGIVGVELGDLITALENLQDRSLDAVVTLDVLEHFTKPELIMIVEKVWEVLKPSGRWIIHTTNGDSPFAGRAGYGDVTHETIFTRNSLRQMLKAYGFCRISCFEDRPIPHGPKSFARYLLWGAIRTALLLYIAVETGDLDRHAIFSQNFTAVAYK